MTNDVPNIEWYLARSKKAGVRPRCPIAHTELCPRYYASYWLLGDAGVTTRFSPQDEERFDDRWRRFKSVVAEEEPSTTESRGQFSSMSKFCPEVAHQVFGYFLSHLHHYSDELDIEVAHRNLAAENAPPDDPRWRWSLAIPKHYTECREYSLFHDVTASPVRRPARRTNAAVSPRTRWIVFSRDGFTCTYCGRQPPEVVLEVDHSVSVAAGGTDDPDNLVTACVQCNRGKGSDSAKRRTL